MENKVMAGGTPANPASLELRASTIICAMADDLERIAPGESARTRARDKKSQPPKVISVNPGLKKLALHLADKRKQKAKKKT